MLLKTNILVTRDTQKFESLEVKGLITIIAKLPSCGPVVFISELLCVQVISTHWKKLMQLLWAAITYLLEQNWTWSWTLFWQCLRSLQAFDIPKLKRRFNENLATAALYAYDRFDSLLVCNVKKVFLYGRSKIFTSINCSGKMVRN